MLNDDQRRLAEQHIPLARRLATPYQILWPNLRDEFESAAMFALVECAGRFATAENRSFSAFARHRIRGALVDVQRATIPRGWNRNRPDPPRTIAFSNLQEPFPKTGRRDDNRLEEEEAADHLLKGLPPRYRAVFRCMYIHRKTQEDTARVLGVSPSRVCQIHQKGLALLRQP
jgi:RNA polymerase sigma factor (sigma-70 family)